MASAASSDVVLVSSEGDRFTVNRAVAQQMATVAAVVEGSEGVEEVPLREIKSAVIEKVLIFCNHHLTNKLPDIEKVCAMQHGGVVARVCLRASPRPLCARAALGKNFLAAQLTSSFSATPPPLKVGGGRLSRRFHHKQVLHHHS